MKTSRNKIRKNKHERIRNTIHGTAIKPRICVFKSLKHFEAQLINDDAHKTILQNSTIKMKLENGGNKEAAAKLGTEFGQKIKELKIEQVVFDRSGYIYHGRLAAFLDAVRKEGIKV